MSTQRVEEQSRAQPFLSAYAGAFLALAALIVAGVLAALHHLPTYGVETDLISVYIPAAKEIADGWPFIRGLVHNPPGYPALLAGLAPVFGGDYFAAAKAVTVLSTAGLVLLSFHLLQLLYDHRIATAATAMLAVALIPYSYTASTDVLGALLMLLPVWIVLRVPALQPATALVAGLVGGVAFLLRSNTLVVIPILSVMVVLWPRTETDFFRRVQVAALMCLGFVVAAGPWFVLNTVVNGGPLASTAYLQIAANFHYPETGDAYFITALPEVSRRFHSAGEVLRTDLLHNIKVIASSLLYRIPSGLATDVLRFPTVLLAGVGLILMMRQLTRTSAAFLLVVAAGYGLLGLVGYYPRYFVFVFPALFTAVALATFHAWPVTARGGRWGAPAILAGCLLYMCAWSARDVAGQLRGEPRHLVAIAEYIRDNSTSADAVLVRKPHLAYLAQRPWTFEPARTAEEFVAAARQRGVKYLVYSDFEAGLWPPLRVLNDTVPDVRKVLEHRATGTVVYELLRRGTASLQ